ncbi:MAG: hypothetical protein WBM98_12300, partial [Maribacter sp.]|uniref:hypothetical protein n=1 Tax=Maribacter sp. TaxID=1897614 RepID=UPI003C77D84D
RWGEAIGRDGKIYSYSLDGSSRFEHNRETGEWDMTYIHIERQDWGETTAEIELGTDPDADKNWLQENTYVDANLHIMGGDIEAMQHEGSVWGDDWGSENNHLEMDVLGYETGGSATLGLDENGLNAEVTANAEVYLFNAEYEGSYGPAYTEAQIFVGAEAEVSAGLNFNPMEGDLSASAGGEAFAGGKLEAEGGLRGDNGTLAGNAGITYGIGGELSGDVGFDDWTLAAEFDVGATLGVGVDLGFEVELDARETASDALDLGKKATGWIPGTPWG